MSSCNSPASKKPQRSPWSAVTATTAAAVLALSSCSAADGKQSLVGNEANLGNEFTVAGPFSGNESVDCSLAESKCIALTFDDGPSGETPDLLDILAEHETPATFFVTGRAARNNLDTLHRQHDEGHEVANHTESHPNLTELDPEEIEAELSAVDSLVEQEIGYEMDLMRPPGGSTDDTVDEVTEETGHAQILWSIDTNDWRDQDADIVTERVLDEAQPGSVVLMHDTHSTTVDAVPAIVEGLEEEGFTMVTVTQLLGETEPGERYHNGHPDPGEEP